MRFGLWKFLLLVVLAAMALGFYGRQWLHPYRVTAGDYYTTAKGNAYARTMWTVGGRLYYCVLCPRSIDVDSWNTGFAEPGDTGVDLSENGIFLDGRQVPMTARVFVYTVHKQMRPVPLAKEELEQVLNFGSMVWLKKIEPVIDEEYQRGAAARKLRVGFGFGESFFKTKSTIWQRQLCERIGDQSNEMEFVEFHDRRRRFGPDTGCVWQRAAL